MRIEYVYRGRDVAEATVRRFSRSDGPRRCAPDTGTGDDRSRARWKPGASVGPGRCCGQTRDSDTNTGLEDQAPGNRQIQVQVPDELIDCLLCRRLAGRLRLPSFRLAA